ncbi:Hermansky-Pudlak syndrome 4 protein isoform X2 [Hypomesus transpacificus]|uniref:Hermansky-Pudlak syndrome 4 protein isoform X2 n=1 Tax=Hypomesus transpacificus TaxID=137520 RepID=UPI001F0796AE|nr:Hermansky-Pudlak syndrome 4 protein isoform X2 [Hypomesus transpacificus]
MAETMVPDSKRCNYFFLYDGSKVKGEGDPTRDGICYFSPEETPLDKQEMLCGQLAGVSRCVSELSSSPVRLLRLRRSKFAIRMKDDFLWALGCSVDIPDVSICEFLDQLIDLFCFYNGPIRHSYQTNSRDVLKERWSKYLSHLQGGSTELDHIFSCLKTIDSTHIDPLLLLKAALILQACQRCPLVLAGCILYRGRVVSTQMPPELTVKVMVHETETYNQDQTPNGLSSSSSPDSTPVTSTTVFLTSAELHCLHSSPVNKTSSSQSTPKEMNRPRKARLSRTLSDTISTDPDAVSDTFPQISFQTGSSTPPSSRSNTLLFSPSPSLSSADPISPLDFKTPKQSPDHAFKNGRLHDMDEGALDCSFYYSFNSSEDRNGNSAIMNLADDNVAEGSLVRDDVARHNVHNSPAIAGRIGTGRQISSKQFDKTNGGADSPGGGEEDSEVFRDNKDSRERNYSKRVQGCDTAGELSSSSPVEKSSESSLLPMALYQHRVRGLVLSLLVEPRFNHDSEAMKEVYHSSLASLNGLEAHLGTADPAGPGPQGSYSFAHFDCIQNTLTTNLSGRPGAAQERSFVRATSLLHSHFSHTETLQEAIVRSAGAAVYGTRSAAQETYFLQQGGTVRNSGIPNQQDSAFSLPTKARHRLLKHGVNLL